MPNKGGLFRKALPYWGGLLLFSAAMTITRSASADSSSGGRLLAGIEPITVIKAILQRPKQLGQVMLCFGLPTLARRAGEQDPLFREDINLPEMFWALAVGTRYHSPQEMLRAGLPLLGHRQITPVPTVRIAATPARPLAPINKPEAPIAPPAPGPAASAIAKKRTVLIFHTHPSESYLPISGQDHLENGAGDIVQVGNYLTQALQAEGFNVVHDTTLNDLIPFREAYGRSLNVARRLVEANPDPLALIDLHRDATPGVVETVELGGEKVACIGFVLGTDRLGLPHPYWRENLAFANSLRDAAERLYPGLVARIITADARYNQHLSPHALIVEIGNQFSPAEEVYRAAACFAKILKEVAPE